MEATGDGAPSVGQVSSQAFSYTVRSQGQKLPRLAQTPYEYRVDPNKTGGHKDRELKKTKNRESGTAGLPNVWAGIASSSRFLFWESCLIS